jgi:tyrosinase
MRTAFGLLAFAVLMAGCTSFTGIVVTESGTAVPRATVRINDFSSETLVDGSFSIRVRKRATYRIHISHRDFANLHHESRKALEGQIWTLSAVHGETFDPSATISLTDRRPELDRKQLEGATFVLPAGALVDSTGNPPAGLVRGKIATLDLRSGAGPQQWGTARSDGAEGFLLSYGAVYIQFTDPSGSTEYQLRNGVSGQLSLPVLPTMQEHVAAAPTAQFWYFDPGDGLWHATGQSTYDAVSGAYRGNVDHLSTINTDIAKFDNAACLAITLDSSVSVGSKLRIRYHSGGTAFGQVPTFVMSDSLNAAYRLPANTNVLLELMSPSDAVFGNLVVEDPAGNPLVNTVVNTGTAIPTGNTLWPPAPFTTCKPIALKLGSPEVEIRVNEKITAPLPLDNPTDDYLTWAPTFALARLSASMGSPVTVVLTNDSPNIGGNVRFAADVSPWPSNTTATETTLSLTLPADGSWVPFVVAGEYNAPGINDKDTIIQAHQGTASGAVIGSKALMVRVRKDANLLSASERDRFLFAWQKFRNATSGPNYILMQEMHRLASSAGDEAHMQPAFLTWHRAFLLLVERELQKIDPSVVLHYWDWDAAAPNIFAENFMGAPGTGGFIAEPEFSLTNPLLGWNTDLPFNGGEIRRNVEDHTRDPNGYMKPLDDPIDPSLIDLADYGPTTPGSSTVNSFSDDVEKFSHNWAHGWPCGAGHLTNPNRSAADPLFYLLHSQIDREWAYWQERHDRLGVISGGALTFPNPQHYDNAGNWNSPGNTPDFDFRQQGSYLEDGIWPWDGSSGGTPMTPQERPPNQATSTGQNVPISMPVIPNSGFPASPRSYLWPAAETVPLNRHMIDYLGRFRPEVGHGFCYDDVPY